MIINNTQANIFKVNGGLADIFANRPAASGSFYVFYSIDTQEIFYDSGTWVLIGTGNLPTPTNIYNSDGTLTGNRTLSGANNDLTFADLNKFKTSVSGNNIGLKLDFVNDNYVLGNEDIIGNYIQIDSLGNYIKLTTNEIGGNSTSFYINDNNAFIKTTYQNNDIGLKLDFANGYYQFGTQTITNGIGFIVDNNSGTISTEDNINGTNGFTIQMLPSPVISFGDQANAGNNILFLVDDPNSRIKTNYQGNDIGLKLDFANNNFGFGQYFGNGNGCRMSIDDNANLLELVTNNTTSFVIFQNIVSIGDINGTYQQTTLFVDYVNNIIKTSYQGNDIGLKLDFANQNYIFGDINKAFINIQNFSNIKAIALISSATVYYTQEPGVGTIIRNELILLAAYSGVNNVSLRLDSISRFAVFIYQNQAQGIDLSFQNKIYTIGQLTGGNATKLIIDDGATYPIQIDGTNILSGTSSGNSGQHLKIKLNGVDYKIKLENP